MNVIVHRLLVMAQRQFVLMSQAAFDVSVNRDIIITLVFV